jgi:hypothetical protein
MYFMCIVSFMVCMLSHILHVYSLMYYIYIVYIDSFTTCIFSCILHIYCQYVAYTNVYIFSTLHILISTSFLILIYIHLFIYF